MVDAAIRRATFELKSGRRMGLTAIKFIHGYGSSGKYLTRLQNKREIRLFVPGERFEIFDQDTQKLLSACRELSRDKDLNRHNNGITVVLL